MMLNQVPEKTLYIHYTPLARHAPVADIERFVLS